MPRPVKNFMQTAVKKPGSFRALAAKKGGLNKAGKIKPEFIAKEKNSSNPLTRKRANLASTFRKFRPK